MYKKLLFGISIILCIIFSFSFCFAADGVQDAVNGVRNVVGGAEKAVEDAAKDVSNASKSATNTIEKDTSNVIGSNMNNPNNYNATRTSAEAGTTGTFMGMSSTAWTWLILGITGIAIIALVWYYSMQFNNNNYNNRNDD